VAGYGGENDMAASALNGSSWRLCQLKQSKPRSSYEMKLITWLQLNQCESSAKIKCGINKAVIIGASW
jgi:hypothetical protein